MFLAIYYIRLYYKIIYDKKISHNNTSEMIFKYHLNK